MFFLLVWTAALRGENRDTTVLTVSIGNIRGNSGLIHVSLFNTAKGFPLEADRAIASANAPASAKGVKIILPHVPYGVYAIAVVHDENENEKVDTNWLGIPLEGVGASGDAAILFGPPDFEDSRFTVSGDSMNVTIKLKYF